MVGPGDHPARKRHAGQAETQASWQGWLTRSLSRDISSCLVSRFCNIILFHIASKWGHYLSCKPAMPPLRYDEAPNQTSYDMKRKNLRDDMKFKSNTPRSDLDLRRLRKLKDPD
ncbi:hypothetical protein POTOM_008649 [Populus tomentosa]|uniref:Uncharacterized protein n=1 Tax=Populus tomentosa TaxID=118781 RepID=A0A8X8AHT1_POPTO|nr:hypothetical protein POTOM_008649 [Populus tomentosa]